MAVEFDDRDFIQSLEREVKRLKRQSENNAEALSELMLRAAQQNTPVRTGRLRSGWKLEKRQTLDGVEFIVSNDVPYVAPQEFGSSHNSPRPMLRPAQARARATAPAIFRRI